jgi:hypothetical protein
MIARCAYEKKIFEFLMYVVPGWFWLLIIALVLFFVVGPLPMVGIMIPVCLFTILVIAGWNRSPM